MRDGKVFSEKVIYPKGNPNNPVTSDELVNRLPRHGELRGQTARAAPRSTTRSRWRYGWKKSTMSGAGEVADGVPHSR